MQSVVAVACKVLRIFCVILTKGIQYDPKKLLGDIRRHKDGNKNRNKNRSGIRTGQAYNKE